jgi:formate/nitrite transporter
MAVLGFDAYAPAQIALKVAEVGVAKARLPTLALVMLGVAAGGFIGLGAMYYTVVVSDPSLPFASARVLGGCAFSLGLILVVVAGAELFTGNNLLVMAWASRRISTRDLARNWAIVYAANAIGAAGLAIIVYWAEHAELAQGAIRQQYVDIAAAKLSMSFSEAFFKGVLCNLLVCLAVWLAMAGRSVADRVLAIIFPVSAFVAAGFEHSVANMYLLPLGMLLGDGGLNIAALGRNLIPVTLGNIVGGSFMVAAVYHLIYNVALKAREPAATVPRAPAQSFARRTRVLAKKSRSSKD